MRTPGSIAVIAASLFWCPGGLRMAGAVVRRAGHDKQQIGEPVQVNNTLRIERLLPGCRHGLALGPAADGPREVQVRSQWGSARQDELREGWRGGLVSVDQPLQGGGHSFRDPLDLPGANLLPFFIGGGEVGPEDEQLGLQAFQGSGDLDIGAVGHADPQQGVQLIHLAVGADAGVVLHHALTPEQAGLALVAGPGVDPHSEPPITASASISTSICGSIRRLTSTIAVAGRISPKNSPWARPTSSHRWMSVT